MRGAGIAVGVFLLAFAASPWKWKPRWQVARGLVAAVILVGIGRALGFSWSQLEGGGRLTGILPSANVRVSGRYGATGGSPTRFDLFALGGASSASRIA